MANQTRKRLLALALALCLALGMLLPPGRVNAEGQSAGILTEVTGEERERLASLADDALALEEPSEEAPAADTPVRVFIVLSGKSALEQGYAASAVAEATAYTDSLLSRQEAVIQRIETRVLEEPLQVRYQFTAVANAISAVVPYGSLEEIAALPGVDSKRFDTSHTFVMQQEGDGWLIRNHSQFDPLVSTLLYAYMEEYADGQWDPERFRGLDFTQDYIDAVPGYLEQVVEQAELRQQQAAEETTTQAAGEPYDREAAVAYADQWIEERSGDWADYTGSGGNCQNYASQVLYAGGIPMDIQGDYIWKWYDDTVSNRGVAWGRSSSWSGVKQFIDYAAGNTGYGLAAEVDAPYDTGEPGDLIHMGVDSDWRHTVVITQPVSDGSGQVVDYLVDSNTANLQDYPASLYGYTDQILVHILGWNQN